MEVYIQKAGYFKDEPAIQNIHFSISTNEIVGLIGGNGAGKSTTIQSILQVIPYFDGDITLTSYGYVPERPLLYEHFTLREHLQFLIDEHEDRS